MAILSCDLQRCCTKVKRCEICVSSTLNQHTSYFHMAVQSCEVQRGCTRVKPSQVCVSDESTKQRSPPLPLLAAQCNGERPATSWASFSAASSSSIGFACPQLPGAKELAHLYLSQWGCEDIEAAFPTSPTSPTASSWFHSKILHLESATGPVSRQGPFRAARNCFTSSAVHSPCLQQFIYNSKSLEGYCRVDRTHWIHWLWLRWLRPQKA